MLDGLLERWDEFLAPLGEIFEEFYEDAFGEGHEPDFSVMVDIFGNFIYENHQQGRLEDDDLTDLVEYFLERH